MGEMIDVKGVPVYKATPAGECRGGLIVIHEVWGLTDHIKDMADRYAAEDFLVYAPNLISDLDIEQHLTPQLAQDLFNPAKRNEAQPKIRALMAPIQEPGFADRTIAKLKAVFEALYNEPATKQKVAVLGYCFGGSYSYSLAIAEPRLVAAVPYYGHSDQPVEELRKIACPLLIFNGENDQNIMSTLPQLEERLHQAGVDYTMQVYAGAGHAFNNYTNPYAYNEAAARDAWRRSLDFLNSQFNH